MSIVFLAFPGMGPLAGQIAAKLSAPHFSIDIHRFPDGESLVTVPETPLGADVAIVATLRNPDPLALPLRFAAKTCRELGAESVGLVAPYLAYMRQDRRFAAGQAVSAPLFAQFLAESFDWLVTVDPHLHRIPNLGSIFPVPAKRVATAPLIAKWIIENVPDAILFGPDSESQQWVSEVAGLANRPYELLRKKRTGDRTVSVSAPENPVLMSGTPVILDDIASSGRTMVQAVKQLVAKGMKSPVCVLIHAVFADQAEDDILAAGAVRIVTTDTIPHPSNILPVADALAHRISEVIEKKAT